MYLIRCMLSFQNVRKYSVKSSVDFSIWVGFAGATVLASLRSKFGGHFMTFTCRTSHQK